MPKLTQEFVSGITEMPESGQVIHRDIDLIGFALRITPKVKSFVVEKRIDGVNRRITIGRCTEMSADEARAAAINLLLDMNNGALPARKQQSQKQAPTLNEVFEKYLTVRTLRPQTISIYSRMVRFCFPDWLNLQITSITKDMIEERFHKISSGSSRGTTGKCRANESMKLLSGLINFAADRYGTDDEPLIKVNPVTRLKTNRAWHHIPARQGTVPDHKLPAFYKALMTLENDTARDYFLLLLLTGLRRTEALKLRWQDIDLEQGLLIVPSQVSKNNREHRLPLSDFLLALLKQRRERIKHSVFVFPGRGNRGCLTSLQAPLRQIRERSGVRFLIHDLRRTFLSMAEKLDLPHYVLKRLINHSNAFDVTNRYIVVDHDRLKHFMNRITNHFLLLCETNVEEYLLWHKPAIKEKQDDHQMRIDFFDRN
jgi:integrase